MSLKVMKRGPEMSEEKPFKSMRITLSDDAVEKLTIIKKRGRFRSYSGTIEEVIRAMYELIPIYSVVYRSQGEAEGLTSEALQLVVDRTMAYLYRFSEK